MKEEEKGEREEGKGEREREREEGKGGRERGGEGRVGSLVLVYEQKHHMHVNNFHKTFDMAE